MEITHDCNITRNQVGGYLGTAPMHVRRWSPVEIKGPLLSDSAANEWYLIQGKPEDMVVSFTTIKSTRLWAHRVPTRRGPNVIVMHTLNDKH